MIVSNKHKENLIKIAKKLEKKSQSFPKDENGEPTETYLEYLSLMYDPEVAKLVLPLPVFPETISVVRLAKQTGLDKVTIIKKLEKPAKRGFIIKLGRSYAQLMPLFVYDMPFILKTNYEDHKDETQQAAYLSRKFYTEEGYYKTWQNSRKGVPRFRVLTVSEEIEPNREIIPIEEVYSLIDKWDNFAIIPCPCRNRAEIEGIRECKEKYPIHNCVLFGPYAKAVLEIEDPIIKAASKEDIINITKEAAEIGLVHCTDNRAENCTILCACCECCCGMLKGLTKLDNPRAIAKANFVSNIIEDKCVACGTCIERCKFDAIKVDEIAQVNVERCVGCGLCAVTCTNDAIIMKRYEREEIPGVTTTN
ncbi:MAG: 4Fe-4S binding protein [Candidatus Thorarchaeota archaeon]